MAINLTGIPDIKVEENIELTRYSTMKLKAFGTLITVDSIPALQAVAKKLNGNYKVLGLGANQVLIEKASVPYIKLNFPFEKKELEQLKAEYTLPASLTLATLTAHAIRFGLKGWEVFTGIPATLGGAVFMNAGTNLGEIATLVKSVKMVNSQGELKVVPVNGSMFSYRKNLFLKPGDVIVEVTLITSGVDAAISAKIREYLQWRTTTQPLTEKTCGCTFKNLSKDQSAGRLIDKVGLKGFQYKGLKISNKHANFIENSGEEATFTDFTYFANMIKEELYINYGILFELEIQY